MMAFVRAVAEKWRYNNETNMVPITKYENKKGAIWVDITIPTDHVVHAQRPDVVIWNKSTKEAHIID